MILHSTRGQHTSALQFIRDFKLEHGYPPTIREIANGIGIKSVGRVHEIVGQLAVAGKLRFMPNRKRAIELIPQSPVLTVELPEHLYAQVQAFAAKAKVTPEAVVIEAVRDGFAALRSKNVSSETSRAA